MNKFDEMMAFLAARVPWAVVKESDGVVGSSPEDGKTPSGKSNMAGWKMDRLSVIFLSKSIHRGFSIAMFYCQRVSISIE